MMPEIRTDRMVEIPTIVMGRMLITPVTNAERTTKTVDKTNNASTDSKRCAAEATARAASIERLCIKVFVT
jgi:hypothetical protein